MNIKLSHLARSGFAVLGTTFGFSILNAVSPIELVNPVQFGQANYHQALALDAEEDINVRVYRAASPAVVAIETETGGGSGSIISPDGLVLTNAHVVSGLETVTVKLSDGREFEGEVIAYGEAGLDLAAVRIQSNERNFPTIEIAPAGATEVGQRAFAIGSPFGFQGTFTTGIISRLDRDRGLIQTDAAINPGNSGGPLLNSRGQLIGVNSAIFSPGTAGNVGIGFAIAIDRVESFIVAVNEGRAPSTPQQSPLLAGGKPAEPLTLGEDPVEVEGKLDEESNVLPSDNSFYNAYTFEGTAGQQITVELNSNEFNSYLILLTPEGENFAQDDDSAGESNSRLEVTLPADGTYTILANTFNSGETGAYTLKVAAAGISPILLKEEGTLGANSQVLQADGSLYDEYSFQGQAGQNVTILLESSDFDPFVILVGPDDQVVGQNDDASPRTLNSLLTATLPVNGTYRIIANAYDQAGRGNYILTVR
ncbi:MAG: hypothetical protein Kow00121_33250 [Elainellaceae cyanobacterium]